MARNTYDQSANFTGEFIQVFDESGKQVAGHKLTHDPWTGVYRCSEWSVAAQDYRAIDCPAGEEESGGTEELKTFTYDEVMKHLEAARELARREQKIERIQPETPVHPPITTVQQEVGLVLPAQLRPGERVSGSLVENPDQYSELPESHGDARGGAICVCRRRRRGCQAGCSRRWAKKRGLPTGRLHSLFHAANRD